MWGYVFARRTADPRDLLRWFTMLDALAGAEGVPLRWRKRAEAYLHCFLQQAVRLAVCRR